MHELDWTYPGPALEQPVKMIFTQEDAFRNLIEGWMGLKIIKECHPNLAIVALVGRLTKGRFHLYS